MGETPANPPGDSHAEATLFGAVLQPNVSLSPRGFAVLMSAIAVVSFSAGIAFLLIGAWPVFGFFGLDVLLVYLAFRASYRRARMFERLELTPSCLVVERVSPRGDVERWSFRPPTWLRVEIDDPPRHESRLVLRSHGRSVAVGAFLTPRERLEVADALRSALGRLHAPA